MHQSTSSPNRTPISSGRTRRRLNFFWSAMALFAGLLTVPALAQPAPPTGCAALQSQTATLNPASAITLDSEDGNNNSRESISWTSVNISGLSGEVYDVDVVTNIRHNDSDDLIIYLISPEGYAASPKRLVTLSRFDGSNDNHVFDGSTFNDDATKVISDYNHSNNDTGPWIPREALGSFAGENPNGNWWLVVFDRGGYNGGTNNAATVNNWSLTVRTVSYDSERTDTYNDGFSTPINIPDNNSTGVSNVINIPSGEAARICDIEVFTNIQHNRAEDIEMTLTSPGGTTVTLTTDNGAGDNDVFGNTTWSDDADNNRSPTLHQTNIDVGGVRYDISVPSDAERLEIHTICDNGDADLYVSFDATPQTNDYDHRSISPDSYEVVYIENPSNGTYSLLIDEYTDFNDLEVVAYIGDNIATLYPYVNETAATNLVPEGALSALIGEAPMGDWTLTVEDDNGGTTGTLDAWSLNVTTCRCGAPGVTVTPSQVPLMTSEDGTSDSFTVVLDAVPTDNVIITIDDSNASGEGSISAAALIFTPSNWDQSQSVTVTGLDDGVTDGNQDYTLSLSAVSADLAYNGISVDDVAVRNLDNDFGLNISVFEPLSTSEAGGSESFLISLLSPPTSSVTIPITTASDEVTISHSQVVFTDSNYNMAETITVTGVNDQIDDGTVDFTIDIGPTTSSDGNYNGLTDSISGQNADDADTAGVAITLAGNGTVINTNENGGTDSFTVLLQSEPVAEVNLNVFVTTPDQVTISPSNIQFSNANWNQARTVTFSPILDDIDEDDVNFTVSLSMTSSDPNYNNFPLNTIPGEHLDNDTAGLSVAATGGHLDTNEQGATSDTFTVRLDSEPVASVTVPIGISNGEATLSTTSFTFGSGNWNQTQTITVTAVDDDYDDGDQGFTVSVGGLTSSDPDYSGRNTNLSGTAVDNDTAAVIVDAGSDGTINTIEGTSDDTFTVRLDSRPFSNVVIGISSSDESEGTVAPASLIFSNGTTNWNQPQQVVVTGIEDKINDGTIQYTIDLAITTPDSSYNGITIPSIPAINEPNNRPPSASSAHILTEQNTPSDPVTPRVDDPDPNDSHRFVLETNPTNGSAMVQNDQLIYTPTLASFIGTDSFTYRAFDQQDLSVIGTADVLVMPPEYNLLWQNWPGLDVLLDLVRLLEDPTSYTNESPQTTNDTIIVAENVQVTIPVLDNDMDPNPIDTLTITDLTSTSNATASIQNNAILYRGNIGFSGFDSLIYTISDGRGGTATGILTVSVTPNSGADSCANGREIPYTLGNPAMMVTDSPAGYSDNEDLCARDTNQADVWFSFNVPANASGGLLIHTDDSVVGLDTLLGLYDENCQPLFCHKDISGANRHSRIRIDDLTSFVDENDNTVDLRGRELHIAVETSDSQGTFVLTLERP